MKPDTHILESGKDTEREIRLQRWVETGDARWLNQALSDVDPMDKDKVRIQQAG